MYLLILSFTGSITVQSSRGESVINPVGGVTALEYDGRGNVSAITDAEGAVTRYEYNDLNQVVKAVQPEGGAMCFCYDAAGNISSVTNAEGNTCSYVYNKNGKVTEITSFDGSKAICDYNSMGKITKATDPIGGVTKYEYDKSWNLVKATNANGAEVYFEYDETNRVKCTTDPEGFQTWFKYDPNGNMTSIIKPSGAETKMEYDALDRMEKATDANGAEAKFVYDAYGNLVEICDPCGNVHKNEYDEAGQLVCRIDPMGNRKAYEYNELGLMKTVINAAGAAWHYEYDKMGRITTFTGADGARETYEYNKNGKVIAATNALGAMYSYSYDCMDRVVSVTGPSGTSKRFEYDALDRVTKKTDENGNSTLFKYDAIGNLIEVMNADGSIVSCGYDFMKKLTHIEQYRLIDEGLADANEGFERVFTKYSYDKRGLLASEEDAFGEAVRYEYTPDGRVCRKTDKDGFATGYEYDPVGMLTKISYADGNEVMLSYDPLRRLKEMKDHLGMARVSMDKAGRVTDATGPDGDTIKYSWTPTGERESITYPDGSMVKYIYDPAGRIKEVLDGDGKAATYQYDAASHILKRMLLNGIKTEYSYGQDGRLKGLVHSDAEGKLDDFSYFYDPAGNKTGINRTRRQTDGSDETSRYGYSYDPMGRLQGVSRDGTALRSYAYDALGNRKMMEDFEKGLATEYEYDHLNRLVRTSGAEGERVFDYDKRGNMVSVSLDGVLEKSFVFGAANKIASASRSDGSTAAYSYDGLGQRVKSVWDVAGASGDGHEHIEKRYILDHLRPHDNILMAYGSEGGTRHVWGNELISTEGGIDAGVGEGAVIDAGVGMGASAGKSGPVFYLHDELRSPVRTVSAGGASLSKFDYDEFGTPISPTVFATGATMADISVEKVHVPGTPTLGDHAHGDSIPSSVLPGAPHSPIVSSNLFGFTGYQLDPVTDLYFAQARYYEPQTGRFVSEDPVKSRENWYTYCHNDPISFIDPMGLEDVCEEENRRRTGYGFRNEFTDAYIAKSPKPEYSPAAYPSYDFYRRVLVKWQFGYLNAYDKPTMIARAEKLTNVNMYIIPRTDWGANDLYSSSWGSDPVKNTIVIHHTVTETHSAEGVRNIDQDHLAELGGIGYHYIIDKYGRVPNDPPPVDEEPLAPAKEINRGGEEYDYDGWIEGAPAPDIYMLVDKSWISDSRAVVAGEQWTDPRNSDAELIYQYPWTEETIPPKEAIWEDFGEIIEKGGDVEYGEFYSKYLSEAYYVKYCVEGYIHIKLYIFYYPQDAEFQHGRRQIIEILSYNNRTDSEDSDATLNENAFWKAAQSIYAAKGYGDGGKYIPYIPEIDGLDIWDGSGHGEDALNDGTILIA